MSRSFFSSLSLSLPLFVLGVCVRVQRRERIFLLSNTLWHFLYLFLVSCYFENDERILSVFTALVYKIKQRTEPNKKKAASQILRSSVIQSIVMGATKVCVWATEKKPPIHLYLPTRSYGEMFIHRAEEVDEHTNTHPNCVYVMHSLLYMNAFSNYLMLKYFKKIPLLVPMAHRICEHANK